MSWSLITLFSAIFVLSAAHSRIALAQKNTSSDKVLDARTTQQKKRVIGETSGLSAILGGEFGIMKVTPDDTKTFDPKKGNALELKILTGWLFDDYMIDSGLGFYYYKIRGGERPVVDGVTILGDRQITVSGVMLEFSPSYRFANNLFAGGVLQVKTPAYNDYFSESNPVAALLSVGGQLGFQFFDRELNSRITLKTITNIGLKGWKDIAYLGGIQFGLPFRQPDSLVIRKTTVVNKLRSEVEYRKKDFTITITANVVKLALDNILTFYVDPSGKPTLTPEAQSFLVDLGTSLQNASHLWETLRIDAQSSGHMMAVNDSLVSIGVPANKIRRGRKTQEIADGGNASVDFTFGGVKDSSQLADKIRKSMKLSKIPENCDKNGTCE